MRASSIESDIDDQPGRNPLVGRALVRDGGIVRVDLTNRGRFRADLKVLILVLFLQPR